MRQNQNSKRSRNRGRKPTNVLNRTMDSNGPDVKIRGTPAHIFEKYQNLARDANASGDRIAAENYLQHAEHYSRLLTAAQAAMQQQNLQRQPNQAENNENHQPSESAPTGQSNGQDRESSEAVTSSEGDAGEETPRQSSRRRNQRSRRPANGDRGETDVASPVASETAPVEASEAPAESVQEDKPKPVRRRRTKAADVEDEKPTDQDGAAA